MTSLENHMLYFYFYIIKKKNMLHWREFFLLQSEPSIWGFKMFLKSYSIMILQALRKQIHSYSCLQRFYDPRYSGDWPLAAETSFGGYAVYNFVGLSLCSLSRKLYKNGTKVQYCNCLMGLHFQFCRYLARAVVLQFGNINIYIYYPPT